MYPYEAKQQAEVMLAFSEHKNIEFRERGAEGWREFHHSSSGFNWVQNEYRVVIKKPPLRAALESIIKRMRGEEFDVLEPLCELQQLVSGSPVIEVGDNHEKSVREFQTLILRGVRGKFRLVKVDE